MLLNCPFLTAEPSKRASSHTVPQGSGGVSFQWGLGSSCWFLTPAVFHTWIYVSSAPPQSCCISHGDSQMEYLLTPNCTRGRMTHFSQAGHTLLPKRASRHPLRSQGWRSSLSAKKGPADTRNASYSLCIEQCSDQSHIPTHTSSKSLRNVILYEETLHVHPTQGASAAVDNANVPSTYSITMQRWRLVSKEQNMLTTKGFSANVRISLSTKACWIWFLNIRFCLLIFFMAKRWRVVLCRTKYTALEKHMSRGNVQFSGQTGFYVGFFGWFVSF